MDLRRGALAVLLLISRATAAGDEARPLVEGRVVDEAGRPVAGAAVSGLWGANGVEGDRVAALGRSRPEQLWRNEGQMMPWGDLRAETDADGRFSVPVPERKRTLWAYDRERRRGAVIHLDPRDLGKPVEARLRPLVKVSGTTRLAAEGPPRWSCTYLNMPYGEGDPLASRRMAICGSYEARFAFLVPPGRYAIEATSQEPRSTTIEERIITIAEGQADVGLGALVLRPAFGLPERIERARARGTWANYKDNIGKRPPAWQITDARGVAKDARLDDFRGKWVALYFWSPNCVPCLGKQLPELMRFYEEHRVQRDRFEILAFCCDFSETLLDIAGLDREIAAVKKAVWGGEDLPFPVILDNTFQTYERFGLDGVSNLLLIDPEGRLAEGDLKSLAGHLDHPGKGSR
jgi:hypothetical protein